MSARNQHVRQSSPYVQVEANGKTYHVYPADWTVDKSKRNYIASKLKAGKIEAPSDAQVYSGITVVYATADNELASKEG